jgi:hypothetical protein
LRKARSIIFPVASIAAKARSLHRISWPALHVSRCNVACGGPANACRHYLHPVPGKRRLGVMQLSAW